MKLFRRIPIRGLVGGLVFVFALVAVQVANVQFASAAVITWDGGGSDDKFSTAANWTGDVAPVTGDSLVFPTVAGGPFTMENDLNSGGTTFIGVDVNGTTNYTVDSITLSTGAVNVTSTGTLNITAGLASNSTLTLNGNSLLTINALSAAGDVTVSTPFTATSATLATTIASMASVFTVTNTLQVDGSLTITRAISVGTLNVDTNLAVNNSFTATNGITVGGNLTMSGAPAITTTGPVNVTGNATFSGTFVGTPNLVVGGDATLSSVQTVNNVTVTGDLTVSAGITANNITAANATISAVANLNDVNVSGNATISGALTAADIDVTGALTVSANFTATTTHVGSFVISSSFNGGGIISYADITTGAYTITATTLSMPNSSVLTISTSGSVVASTSITVGSDSADTLAKIVAGSGTTINTPSITVYGNASNASSLGGTLSGTPSISLPNGSLTLSSASTVGAVNVANVLTASNFTAASVTTDTLVISASFTVTGTLDVNSTSTPLTVNAAIVVGTLDVADDLSVTTGFTANTAVIVAGNLITSAVITGVDTITVGGNATLGSTFSGSPAPTITVTGGLTVSATLTALNVTAGSLTTSSAFTTTGTLTVVSALTTTHAIVAPTLVAQGGLTINSAIVTTTINVTGNLTISANFTATTVNVSGDVTSSASNNSGGHVYVVGGDFDITSGIVYLGTGTDITGMVSVETTSTLRYVTGATNVSLGSLVVENNSFVYLEGTISYPVTFGSGTNTAMPTLGYNNSSSYTTDVDGNIIYTILKFTGPVILLNDLQLNITGNAYSGVIEFAGALTYNNYVIRKSATTSGILVINGVEVRNPTSVNEYSGDQPSTNINVGDNDVAVINGIRGTVSAYRGGLVKGTGTVVNLTLNYGATVNPGNSPGKLTVLDNLYFQEGANYYAEIQSTSAYDQLAVGEEYSSPSGSPVDLNDANLNVVLSEGFEIAQGNKFTIIDNKSSRPITTTFKNLAEGTVFSVADGTFSISYVGGDGNDVVLTVVSAPSKPAKAPNTGFKVLSSNPLLILGLGIITAGFFLALSSRRLSITR